MIMSISQTQSAKNLINEIPLGFIVDSAWFTLRGIATKSIHHYVQQGWIERVVRGVYRRPLPARGNGNNRDLPWQTVLLSLQHLMGYNVHLGAHGALDINGSSKYAEFGDSQHVHFYGHAPSWIRHLHANRKIIIHNATMFNNSPLGIIEHAEIYYSHDWAEETWQWAFNVSRPERAILELIDMLPNKTTFEYVKHFFNWLDWIKPDLMMDLLKICRSAKVKRLFFVYMELFRPEWMKDLNPHQIDFGKGHRSLVPNGIFDSTYHVSFPKGFINPIYYDGRKV